MSETIIEERMANSLFVSAEARVPFPANIVVWLFHVAFGGTWVGGRVRLTSDSVMFEPNDANVILHRGGQSLRWSVPVSSIKTAERRKSIGMQIVDMTDGERTYTFRCYKADAFIEAIRQQQTVLA
ncbi:hypothetical protein FF098_006155 [Parvularcula flava]|uniref:Uncharacterized protein n=1 Tax=Aquisalinus luteolus TaxID=1566827 RepID=A0A8J3A2K7_9PROT|nr:hypothetical protein [Aquisalinus luteolus]NHK27482.1 hypothetical protein [Aquisalinus luteolus]GGH95568.1 hypothetical protein GCM10011355_12420 [Aquisalinus luteolus]